MTLTLTKDAHALATELLGRVKTPEQFFAINKEAMRQTEIFEILGAEEHPGMHYDLTSGCLGAALAFGELHQSDPKLGYDLIAHDHLTSAARYFEEQAYTIPLGMANGLSGLLFTIEALSLEGERYQNLLQAFSDVFFERLDYELSASSEVGEGESTDTYDHISGFSGMVVALLALRNRPKAESYLRKVLLWLTQRASLNSQNRLGFYTPRQKMLSHELENGGEGFTNCGLSHGVAAPLAALSIAWLNGVRVEGMKEAIYTLALWLKEHMFEGPYGPETPYLVFEDFTNTMTSRTAWCYGVPGVARSLSLAGHALGDESLKDYAHYAFISLRKRPVITRDIPSPTFCHGVSGLLHISRTFSNDHSSTDLRMFEEELWEQLMESYEPEAATRFRDIELRGQKVEKPGLLEGSVGIALVLLKSRYLNRLFLLN